jgi:hypothetical protein
MEQRYDAALAVIRNRPSRKPPSLPRSGWFPQPRPLPQLQRPKTL